MRGGRPADARDDLLGRLLFVSPKGKHVAVFRRLIKVSGGGSEPVVAEHYDEVRSFNNPQAAFDWLREKTGGTTLFDLSTLREDRS